MEININCDLGEKSKFHSIENDPELLKIVNSASIACGYHAGDEETMKKTVDLAIKHNVSIGAHPSFADKENIGIWYNDNKKTKKVAAIGVRISKWIAYHGFSINICNNLEKYNAIIPCGIKDKGVTNLKQIKDQDYKELDKKLVEIFISNLNK